MKRNAQSILDIILPNRMMLALKSPITNKEAKTLLQLWECDDKDQYGRIRVPTFIDGKSIVSLASKGYISTMGSRAGIITQASAASVTLTKKGENIIKKIILHAETSSFENKEEPDYESILIMAEQKQAQSKGKVASKQSRPEPTRSLNWLQKRAQGRHEGIMAENHGYKLNDK